MDTKLEPIVKIIQEKFSATFEEFRDEVHLFLKPEQIVDALTLLRDEHKFELLSALTAVDYYPQTKSAISCGVSTDFACAKSVAADQSPSKRDQPQSADCDGRLRCRKLARA